MVPINKNTNPNGPIRTIGSENNPSSLASQRVFRDEPVTPIGQDTVRATLPVQNLSDDKLILSAPRKSLSRGLSVPALGGIPLLSKIGQGGMGSVYYGIHPRLKREVAIKVLPFDMAEKNPDSIKRFFHEAQLAASVTSQHLIAVFDVNEEAGLFYMVMEYIDGGSAQNYLRNVISTGAKGLSEFEALDLCIAVCTGIAAAHVKGIIHRDVKPDNLMIPRNHQTNLLDIQAAKLADLGLARSDALDRSLVTQTGACMGTPGFAAPEQIGDAKKSGKPADVFGMGATLYALLTGHSPFSASVIYKVLKATIDDPHTPIRSIRPEITVPTADLIDCCLAKDASQRYVDASAMLAALKICRAALGEPAQTKFAVDKVAELVRAKEVGQPVRDSNPLATPQPAQPASSALLPISPPPNKSRWALWAALLFVSAMIGLVGWQYKDLVSHMFAQAQIEVNRSKDFNAKLNAAQNDLYAQNYAQALKSYSEARTIWPNAPRISEVDVGEKSVNALLLSRRFNEKLAESDAFMKAKSYDNALKSLAEARTIWPQAPTIEKVTQGESMAHDALADIKQKEEAARQKKEAADKLALEEAAETNTKLQKEESARRQSELNRLAFTNNVALATEAMKKYEWSNVVELLETLRAFPENADNPSCKAADMLLTEAKSELKKIAAFNAALAKAQAFLHAQKYNDALTAFAEARTNSSNTSRIKEVEDGENKVQAALLMQQFNDKITEAEKLWLIRLTRTSLCAMRISSI